MLVVVVVVVVEEGGRKMEVRTKMMTVEVEVPGGFGEPHMTPV